MQLNIISCTNCNTHRIVLPQRKIPCLCEVERSPNPLAPHGDCFLLINHLGQLNAAERGETWDEEAFWRSL